MSREVFTLHRRLTAANGTSILIPLGVVTDEKLLDGMEQEEARWLAGIARANVVVDTPDGPRILMPVINLLNALGVDTVATLRGKQTLKESSLVVPKLVLPSG